MFLHLQAIRMFWYQKSDGNLLKIIAFSILILFLDVFTIYSVL